MAANVESSSERPLPNLTDLQGTLAPVRAAEQAAWNVRRAIDAARGGPIWGSLACLVSSLAAAGILDSAGPKWLMIAWFGVFAFGLLGALAWLVKSHPAGEATVVDHFQANAARLKQPGYLALNLGFAFGCFFLWGWLSSLLPYSAMTLMLMLAILLMAGTYVARFCYFWFWQDLAFALCVLLAWMAYLYQPQLGGWALLALAMPLLAGVSVWLLRRRGLKLLCAVAAGGAA
jgi:hypothetical protein